MTENKKRSIQTFIQVDKGNHMTENKKRYMDGENTPHFH